MHATHQASMTRMLLIVTLLAAALGASLARPANGTAQALTSDLLATQFFNAVDGDTPAYMFDGQTVLHTPEGTYAGATSPARFGDVLGESFSNVEFAIASTGSAGDTSVIATFTLTAINTGAYRGLDANCAAIAVPGAALFQLSEREVIASWWEQDNHNYTQPPLETVTVVSELWLNYDADLMASQIAAFNALDSTYRPGCDSNHVPGLAPELPAYEPPPSCPSPRACDLPY